MNYFLKKSYGIKDTVAYKLVSLLLQMNKEIVNNL